MRGKECACYASLRLLLRKQANTNTHAAFKEIPNLYATSSIVRSLSIRGTTSLSLNCTELILSDLLLLLVAHSSVGRSTPAPPASPTSAISSDVAPKGSGEARRFNGLHSTSLAAGCLYSQAAKSEASRKFKLLCNQSLRVSTYANKEPNYRLAIKSALGRKSMSVESARGDHLHPPPYQYPILLR